MSLFARGPSLTGAVALNVALNFVLVWPLAEAGLAAATTLAAAVQVAWLVRGFARRGAPLDWAALAKTAARTALATSVMGVLASLGLWLVPPSDRLFVELLRVVLPALLGLGSFLALYRVLSPAELRLLLAGDQQPDSAPCP